MVEVGVLHGSGGFRRGEEKSRAVMCIVWCRGYGGFTDRGGGRHEADTRGLEEGSGRQEGKPGFCSA